MARSDDLVSDAMRRLASVLSRDERAQLEIALRAEHGGKHYYVRKTAPRPHDGTAPTPLAKPESGPG